ncbi:MAG: hypothetical protein LJE69_05620 [Thiohalocapsa sp.]|uniref:hypothetical protein n=1 Tax=Thiohalocapsa sp. TaxID=2497641 RepID=UPI0025DFC029|nr:hypothetical protein [Thiohalocapsa sp.]MCG6940712.1 hypothetical protein [Thiohalocapsa sp.]
MLQTTALALALAFAAGAALAQTGSGAGVSGGPGYEALEPLHGGATITSIVVEVEPPDAPGADALRATVRDALSLRPGDVWDPMLGAAIRARLKALPKIRTIDFAGRIVGGGVGRQLVVTVWPAMAAVEEPARGILVSRDLADFPVLYRRGGRYLQVILNASPTVSPPSLAMIQIRAVTSASIPSTPGAWTSGFRVFPSTRCSPRQTARPIAYG